MTSLSISAWSHRPIVHLVVQQEVGATTTKRTSSKIPSSGPGQVDGRSLDYTGVCRKRSREKGKCSTNPNTGPCPISVTQAQVWCRSEKGYGNTAKTKNSNNFVRILLEFDQQGIKIKSLKTFQVCDDTIVQLYWIYVTLISKKLFSKNNWGWEIEFVTISSL